MIPIIDVSKWQGAIDWRKVAESGIPGAIIRAGNGGTADPRLALNIAGARAAGLLVGVYWFCNPKAALSAAGQGRLLAVAHMAHGCELPPMWDVEAYSTEAGPNPVLVGAPMARWLAVFVDEVDTARFSLGYSGASFWNSNVAFDAIDALHGRVGDQWRADIAFLVDHDFILARYPGWHRLASGVIVDFLPRGIDPGGWAHVALLTGKEPQALIGRSRSWDGWQWSAGGNAQGPVYGMQSSDLDLNIIKDEAWQRWTSSTPLPQPSPPSGDDDMATVFFAVEGMPGQYMWTPGSEPIPFTNPTDRDMLLRGLGINPDSGVTISQEMFARLTPPMSTVTATATGWPTTIRWTGGGVGEIG